MPVYKCYKPECQDKEFIRLGKLLRHIRDYHEHEPNFQVTCGLKSRSGGRCQRTFKKWSTFTSHISRCHDEYATEEGLENYTDNLDLFSDDTDPGNDCDKNADNFSETDEDYEEDFAREKARKHLASFILKTQELNKVSEKATFSVLEETSHEVCRNLDHFKSKLISCLNKSGITPKDVDGLENLIAEKPEFTKVYKGLDNQRQLRNYMIQEMQLVVSY